MSIYIKQNSHTKYIFNNDDDKRIPKKIKYKTYLNNKLVSVSYTLTVTSEGEPRTDLEQVIDDDIDIFRCAAASGSINKVLIYVNNELCKELLL